jgi:hypothetical protein
MIDAMGRSVLRLMVVLALIAPALRCTPASLSFVDDAATPVADAAPSVDAGPCAPDATFTVRLLGVDPSTTARLSRDELTIYLSPSPGSSSITRHRDALDAVFAPSIPVIFIGGAPKPSSRCCRSTRARSSSRFRRRRAR